MEGKIEGDLELALALTHDGASLSATGLSIPEGLPFEQWSEMTVWVWHVHQGINWALGDALNYGEREYGNKYAQAIKITGQHYNTLATACWVARQFPPHMRRASLPFTYHVAVASLVHGGYVDDAMEILDKAESGELKSEREVRFDAKQARIAVGIDRQVEWIPEPLHLAQEGQGEEREEVRQSAPPLSAPPPSKAPSWQASGADFEGGMSGAFWDLSTDTRDFILGVTGLLQRLVECLPEDHHAMVSVRADALAWFKSKGILAGDEEEEEREEG